MNNIDLDVRFTVPHAFGGREQSRSSLPPVTCLVGPNGAGKSTYYNKIMEAARRKWPSAVKSLSTGRLGPMEKSTRRWIGTSLFTDVEYDDRDKTYLMQSKADRETAHDAFAILNHRLDLRIRIQEFLRHVFNRQVFLKSTRQGLDIQVSGSEEGNYNILEECHGIKELVTILTFLYDDKFKALGIDEPELHLHPQFQRFLANEIRGYAGHPDEGKKLVVLVTHSPIFLSLVTPRDLESVVVFPGIDKAPQAIVLDQLSEEAKLQISRMLPQLNSSQKELFFAQRPVFVEGMSDSTILEAVIERISVPLGAAGVGVAAIGGKERLIAYRPTCLMIGKEAARFILDLDAVIDAKTLATIEKCEMVQKFLSKSGAGGRTLSQEVGQLIQLINSDGWGLVRADGTLGVGPYGHEVFPEDARRKPRAMARLLAALRAIPENEQSKLNSQKAAQVILGKVDLIRKGAMEAGVYILSKGSIEAYFREKRSLHISDWQKREALESELDAISKGSEMELVEQYGEILSYLPDWNVVRVPVSKAVRDEMIEFATWIQTQIGRGNLRSIEEVHSDARAKARNYADICEITRYKVNSSEDYEFVLAAKESLGGFSLIVDASTTVARLLRDS